MLCDRVHEKMAGIRSVRRGSDGKPAAGRLVTGHTTLDRAIFGSLKQAHDRKPSCLPPAGSIASDWIKEVPLAENRHVYVHTFAHIPARGIFEQTDPHRYPAMLKRIKRY